MKLYSMSGTCALAVHIALEWAAAPYELELMPHGDNQKPAYLAINPSGQVPAIVLDDGQVLTQAAAILTWIADTHPGANLGSASANPLGRFALESALAHLTSDIHAAFGPFFAPQRFIDDEALHDTVKRLALDRVAGEMAKLNETLGDRTSLLAERTVADAYVYVLTRWADNLPTGITPFPNLARFRRTMEQDAGVKAALSAQDMPLLGD